MAHLASSILFPAVACAATVSCGGAAVEPPPASEPAPQPAGGAAQPTSPTSPWAPFAPTPTTSCTPSGIPGETVHACGLPAVVQVVALNAEHVAVVSRATRFSDSFTLHRLDRGAAKLVQVFEAPASGPHMTFAASPARDVLVWNGRWPGASAGVIQTLDLRTSERRFLADGTGVNIVASDTSVYWDSVAGIETARLDATGPGTQRTFVGDASDTLTFGAAGGFLYYAVPTSVTASALFRRPEGGGAAELVATELPAITELAYSAMMTAIDTDGGVYLARNPSEGPRGFEIVRVKDGTKSTLVRCRGDFAGAPCPSPAWLALHGDAVFVGLLGNLGWSKLVRVAKSQPNVLSDDELAAATMDVGGVASDSAPAVFEGDRLWVGYLRGNEGVVVSRPIAPQP